MNPQQGTAQRHIRQSWSAAAMRLALAAAIASLGTAALQAQEPAYAAPDQQTMADPPARAARISYLRGSVSLQANGAQDWAQAVGNYPMSSGDRLFADQDGRAELQVGNSAIRLDSATDLTLTDLTDNFLQLGLASGTIHLRTFGLNPGDSQEIDTPNGAILVTQPGDIRITSYAEDGGTYVQVFSGSVQLTGPDLNQSLYAGTEVQLTGTNPVYVSAIQFPGPDDFDLWSQQRDRRMLDSVSARYVSRQMPGYEDLDQYGQWDPNAPGYGPVWYPTAVPYGWSPYSTGYWAQVGPWGWTWVDTTGPWGYAPFHYGRWVLLGPRWAWVPGPAAVAPVYSPALVAFAGGRGFAIGVAFGGGGGIAAWFPLGPRDPFLPWYRCSNTYVTNVNVTNVTVINRTYVNETINNYNVNHTTINNYNYANVNHVVAVPSSNFGSGHPVQGEAIKLTPQQLQSVRPIVGTGQVPVRPPVNPTRPAGLAPVTHVVAAPVARPNVITPRGMATAAPGARVQPVPRGMASVNSNRPAPTAPRGAVTGNRPLNQPPAGPKSDVVPAIGQPYKPATPTPSSPTRPVIERTPPPAPPQRPVPQPIQRPTPAPAPVQQQKATKPAKAPKPEAKPREEK